MNDTPNNYVILPHWNAPQLLMLTGDAGWTLPLHHESDAPDIIQAIQDRFGLPVTVLEEAYDNFSRRQSEAESLIYVLDNHSSEWTPPEGAHWIGLEDLTKLTLAIPEHKTVLETWFLDATSGSHPYERVPWSQRGWFETAVSWIETQLHHLNYTLVGDIQQVQVSLTSCVLSAPTTSGNIYFKACASLFKYEPALTQTISHLLPTYSLRVLKVDYERSWMLMEDVGPTLRTLTQEKRDLKRWERMLSAFAHFQMDTIPHITQLKVAGCPGRTLARIPDFFDALLADSSVLLVDQKGGVPGSEMEQLYAFKPQLVALCDELTSYNIPETLHHDDLTAGNIALNEHDYIFFDWAESGITHPFCSLLILLRVAKYIFEFSEDELMRMRDVYLAEWISYQPMEHLRHAFELAQRLAILCRCLTWHYVITYIEESAKAEILDATPYWLCLFLHNGEEFE